ncbi:hypothetical protein [Natronomonas sp.]|uniref:hypothetical protein n=1 Tax=Natronomonas sp. TaxID=2184060 RepID=UPI00262CD52B|nr:hypothetical protein [Natronomonas sp.]
MAASATEKGSAKHELLRAVVCWHLSGGLLGRVTDKLEVAVPEAETQLAGLDPSDDRGLTTVEKKRRWLADELTPGPFPRDVFGRKLEAMSWRGGDTKHMRKTHLQPVLNRIGYTEHPNNRDLFIPKEQAREYAEEQGIDLDAPAFEWKPYYELTDDERTHGLRVELVRRAARCGGKHALSADKARSQVFDGTPGTRKVKGLMDWAADGHPAFETDAKGGRKRLRCDLGVGVDPDMLADAGLTTDTDPREVSETDENELKTGIKEDMDRIIASTPPVGDRGKE